MLAKGKGNKIMNIPSARVQSREEFMLLANKKDSHSKEHKGPFSSSSKLTTSTGLVTLVAKEDYVNQQFVAIQEEAAQGQGPHLQVLSQLLDEPDSVAFGQWMQTHYQVLFTELDRPEALLIRIDTYRVL